MTEILGFVLLAIVFCFFARIIWKIFKVAIDIVVGFIVMGVFLLLGLFAIALILL